MPEEKVFDSILSFNPAYKISISIRFRDEAVGIVLMLKSKNSMCVS